MDLKCAKVFLNLVESSLIVDVSVAVSGLMILSILKMQVCSKYLMNISAKIADAGATIVNPSFCL
jgi:hypothetical protein